MKVIILGLGQVGSSIAKYLANDQNNITVVDNCQQKLDLISSKIDVKPVFGFASHPDVLKEAGAANADLIIAVTSSDEVNIVSCEIAKKLFNVPLKIARIRHQDYLSSNNLKTENLSIDVAISPELEVAEAINRNLVVSGAFDVVSLIDDNLKLLGIRCLKNSPITNTPVKSVSKLFPDIDLAIVLIKRQEQIIFPKGTEHILADDEVYVLATKDQINNVTELFGHHNSENREILIIGGGKIGLNLALAMETNHHNIKATIIEKDIKRCEEIAKHLKHTQILQGDALDYDLLQEANISTCETAICVSNDDKVNILSSLISKRQGARRSLALLKNMQYANMVTSIGTDAVISPQSLTVSNILKHVREENLSSIFPIADGEAVIVEAVAKDTSHIVGLEIEDVTITSEIIIVALLREETLYLMPSNMHINAKDNLIILVGKNSVHKVEKLFSIRPYYL